ncbi:MAG: hypothetical protein MUC36_07530 [Planctomycetes bacterium]|jgi:hypothetical protein|nr:hypothetical protein [Planctomycetota bacterium]
MASLLSGITALLLSVVVLPAQSDPDRDGDGLSDFQEIHKYRTDPDRADSDGDGVPDGDWLERREYQYTVRTVVQVMRPVTIGFLCDDHQDARVLDETTTHVELEVIHYPFTTVSAAIVADGDWRRTAAGMKQWTEPGPTNDWTPAMQEQLVAALLKDGIDCRQLDDKALVEQVSRWLCRRTKDSGSFMGFITAFDERGQPFVPPALLALTDHAPESLASKWSRDVSARGMFEQSVRGSCSSSSIYLNGCLRALGIPTRTILTIPLVDANDDRELRMVERGISHHGLKATVLPVLRKLNGSWASHSFNEVFVGGRWRRLNYDRLGQDIVDPILFGMLTHVATFSDWADARMPDTIGWRQTRQVTDDVFGTCNPYSTIALRDAFGPHCKIDNPAPPPAPPPQASITEVQWGDGDAVPADIREWFGKRRVFGLVARVEGISGDDDFRRWLIDADCRVVLSCKDQDTLHVGLDALAWWRHGDHFWIVVPFDPADRQDLVAGQFYEFECRNRGKGGKWRVADGVRVPLRK